jgi:CheY-like chemotaxis protein
MFRNQPIILIEDDKEDCDLFISAFRDLGIKNDVICFEDAITALNYLKTTKDKILLIICDINMPVMNGLQLLKEINENTALRKKRIPFIYFSTSNSPKEINEAYDLNCQGYFMKSPSFHKLKIDLSSILHYWKNTVHPNVSVSEKTKRV